MSKIKVKKIINVECYDFQTKSNIPFNKVLEVEETNFIKTKLEEGVLEKAVVNEESEDELNKDIDPIKEPEKSTEAPVKSPEELEESEKPGDEVVEKLAEPTEGGVEDDNSKSGKGKKKG